MTLADQEMRRRAIHERERNVLVEASAGTGKTSLVVERLLEMVAPSDGGAGVPIERVAAITFTRKAAGELRVRVRQRLLELLSLEGPRSPALLRALGGIDTASITTIHGFADELLRRWPARALLDPSYMLEEHSELLVAEGFDLLLQHAETSTLSDLVTRPSAIERCDEAAATVLDAQRAGLRTRSRETEHWTYRGLDELMLSLVLHRDVGIQDPAPLEFDRQTFERAAREYLELVRQVDSESSGARWLRMVGELVRGALAEPDPIIAYRDLVQRMERGPRGRTSDDPRKGHDFVDDEYAWSVWLALAGDKRKRRLRDGALRDELLAPLREWLAIRLIRLRPVVLDVYERVKGRRRVVDHVDLLLRLRDLLASDLALRGEAQRAFDHIFIDEFQDTDRLQGEIALFLAEEGASASSWDAVRVAPGKLTLVGDPKQSIYRFRRADIATYQAVLAVVSRSPTLSIQLTSSFRSVPPLVDWINDRFGGVLGGSDEDGNVAYRELSAGRRGSEDPAVHVVPVEVMPSAVADEARGAEAQAMSRYLRWLVEVAQVGIVDPLTGQQRRAKYSDVGVLAISTSKLGLLFDAFDADGVPYAARGGSLFLADPLSRQFLLGLCAIADRDDGVALAALLRPPFFAVTLGDLARSRSDDPDDRVVQARAVVGDLRRQRFARAPGATARALLEATAIGRVVACGPNGAQRLGALYELCFQVEARAFNEALDFDTTMERLRGWITDPASLDRPHPVGEEAVRVLTVHQAKGLEFPITVLWDARASWSDRLSYEAWNATADGSSWELRLDTLTWSHPPGFGLADRELAHRTAERKRLVYVAATRARDLLVIPEVGPPNARWIAGRLLSGEPRGLTRATVHSPAAEADWFVAARPSRPDGQPTTTVRDVEQSALWSQHALQVSTPSRRPLAFSDASSPTALWGKKGRFGTDFGTVVHLAIGHALANGSSVSEAVAWASVRVSFDADLEEAKRDVTRALRTLEDLGVPDRFAFVTEYPVSGLSPQGELLSGYVDLVVRLDERIVVLDFKTDHAPDSDSEILPRYVEQVRGYARALRDAFSTPADVGLLYTADGHVRWLTPGDDGSP